MGRELKNKQLGLTDLEDEEEAEDVNLGDEEEEKKELKMEEPSSNFVSGTGRVDEREEHFNTPIFNK